MKLICKECNEECSAVEETFGYPGTHCNYGRTGTHHTGIYVSDCCLGETDPYDEWLGRQEIKLAVQ